VQEPASPSLSPYRLNNTNWLTLIVLILFHIGALAAPFFFEWRSFFVALVLYWICISGGIGMGYHRLLTHRGYKTPLWFEYFLAVCGTMTLQGGPMFWVATHRVHHQRSDQEGDPHSPRDGAWWAHILWIVFGASSHNKTWEMSKYAPDLAKHRFYRWLNTYHYVPLALSGVILFAWGGLPMLLWAGVLRVVIGLHSTWLVNSATHLWGARRFKTTDDSRNNWWVALLTFGEGWHNNHHAHPVSSRHGLAWYELDLTWLQIKTLEKIGLIWNVQAVRLPLAEAGRRAA
jgi:stearoyl-CoA desaturase (delta-9 desaturase)